MDGSAAHPRWVDGAKKRKAPESVSHPRKRFYRQRAHANPFSDHDLHYPTYPGDMDWSRYFPGFIHSQHATQDDEKKGSNAKSHKRSHKQSPEQSPEQSPRQLKRPVEVLDIGCGFGGLLVALAPMMPDTLMLGLEIRTKVAQFVDDRIAALRAEKGDSQSYGNVACLRANAMKFLPNFFPKGQLAKIFICFPDPHFKARKHKARIVSATLNSEYAYILRPGGIVYTITDVQDLHQWMVEHFDAHPAFERVSKADEQQDDCVSVMSRETEESKKVERNKGPKYVALFRRQNEGY